MEPFDYRTVIDTPEFRAAIRRKGVSKVAELIGSGQSNVSDWVRGARIPSLEYMLNTARAIGWVVLVRAHAPKKYRKRRKAVAVPPSPTAMIHSPY